MTANELQRILNRHKKWLNGEYGGNRADLSGADLTCATLTNVDLRRADLRGANLYNANLHHANLRGADLRGANLCRTNLYGVNLWSAALCDDVLRDADLCHACLSSANLRDAVLNDADLCGANLSSAYLGGAVLRDADLRDVKNLPDLPWTSIVPETGSFIGWKKVYLKKYRTYVIIKLEILENAKRCNATGRKCRCSAAKVLEIQKLDGTPADLIVLRILNIRRMQRTR